MYFLVLVSFCFALASAAKIDEVRCPNHPVSSYTVHFPSPTNQIFYTARDTLIHLSDEHKVSYSTDIGRSWNLVAGIANKTIRRIYVSPDRSHVIYMGFGNDDMWLSDNGGSTITATAHSPGHLTNLKFHPKDPQWVLGITRPGCRGEATCSQDLYFSPNAGLDWGRIRTYVENVFWHEGSAAVKQNLVVQERFLKEGNMYRQRGRIDLVKSDTFFRDDATSLATEVAASLAIRNHIFIAKWEPEGGFQLWASMDMGDTFKRVRFSESLKENSYTILDLSEGSAFIGVSHGPNFGHVYAGDTLDQDFVLSLKNNIRSRPGARPVGTDFRPFRGIEGVYVANVWKRINEDNGQGNTGSEAQTLISYDKGGEWKALAAPDKSKRLNILGPAEEWGGFYSRSQAIGIMFASGMVGDVLSTNPTDHGLFVTRDAGWSWNLANNGSHAYEIGNKGAMVIAAKDEEFTNTYQYSLNEGETWNECNLFNYKAGVQTPRMDIDNIISDPTLSSKYFVLFGDGEDGTGFVSVIDFGGVHERECNELDYEFWEPSDRDGDECLLGRRTIYKRRRAESMCFLPDNFESVGNVVKNCPCDYENYMCEFCYVRDGEKCVFDDANPLCAPFHPVNLTKNCPTGAHMILSQGYRKVAGDSCNVSLPGSLNLLPRNVTCGDVATSSSSAGVIALVFVAILLIVIGVSWYLAGTNETFRNALAQVIPEKFLPDRSRDVPSAEYSQLGSTQAFDAEAGVDEEDARELKIGSESSSESS